MSKSCLDVKFLKHRFHLYPQGTKFGQMLSDWGSIVNRLGAGRLAPLATGNLRWKDGKESAARRANARPKMKQRGTMGPPRREASAVPETGSDGRQQWADTRACPAGCCCVAGRKHVAPLRATTKGRPYSPKGRRLRGRRCDVRRREATGRCARHVGGHTRSAPTTEEIATSGRPPVSQ